MQRPPRSRMNEGLLVCIRRIKYTHKVGGVVCMVDDASEGDEVDGKRGGGERSNKCKLHSDRNKGR